MSLFRGLVVGVLLATASIALADEGKDGWTVLSNDLKAWNEPTRDWFLAGGAKIDPTNKKRLVGEPGRGVMINGKNRTGDITTRESFGDVEVSLDFMIPNQSNSGIKLEAVYEVQIFDSWKVAKPTGSDCGGIYPRAELKPTYHHIDEGYAPLTNACKKPGEWQTLHIEFRAPRFDAAGKKIANAKFEKVELNGKLVQDNLEVPYPTGNNWHNREHPTGPILLQADHGPVAFRNMRVRPLAEKK